MTTLFYKSEDEQILLHRSNRLDIQINLLATSYDGSTNMKLFRIDSNVVTEEYLKKSLDFGGEFIDLVTAYKLGKELQPDRTLQDVEGNDYEYTFIIVGYEEIDEVKKVRILELNIKTKALIMAGFEYNSITMGSDEDTQRNWNTLLCMINLRLSQGMTEAQLFPIVNKVKNWAGEYITVNDLTDLIGIISTGEAHVNGYRDSHKTLLDQVNACTTIEELDGVIDNRL